MNALRALLNAPPIAIRDDGSSKCSKMTDPVHNVKEEPLDDQNSTPNPKLKKKAAFEAWHSKKFGEVLQSGSRDSMEEPENDAPQGVVTGTSAIKHSKKSTQMEVSELRKILSAPPTMGQNESKKDQQPKENLMPTNTGCTKTGFMGNTSGILEQAAMQLGAFHPHTAQSQNMDLLSLLLKQLDTKTLIELLHQSLLSSQQPTNPIALQLPQNMPISLHNLNTTSMPNFIPGISMTSSTGSMLPHHIIAQQNVQNSTLLNSSSCSYQRKDPLTRKPSKHDDLHSKAIKAHKLTKPRLSRHNDAAYYPNIQCILCKEWVCSRNRHMHIESHLQYRPYKCSICGYDNRKEIFINLHIRKAHPGCAQVVYTPNPDLEHRAWLIAEECLQHTREVLSKGLAPENIDVLTVEQDPMDETGSTSNPESPSNWAPILEKHEADRYANKFRPKIFNALRIEKSQIIEESRIKGLMPDLSEVANKETKCEVCSSYVLSSHNVMEEHARIHLSQSSYQCPFENCTMTHSAKNFVTRHMKEMHKIKKHPIDLVQLNDDLKMDFAEKIVACFPEHYKGLKLYTRNSSESPSLPRASEDVPNVYIEPNAGPSLVSGVMSSVDSASISQNSDSPTLKSLYSTLSSLLFDDPKEKVQMKQVSGIKMEIS